MTRQANPIAWMTWGGAVTLATIVTRNPFYLSLAFLATLVVFAACRPRSTASSIWSLVIKIGGVVAVVSVAFNLLTAHAGTDILFHIPSSIPVAGGDVTFNALVYGISSALAIVTLIVAAATFASVVDRAALLRTVPRPLASAGIAAVIGLSFFPQTLSSLREVRQAQAARGFRVRSIRDVVPLVVPVLSLGLEGAFNLAEAMESRAFGGERRLSRARTWVFPSGIVFIIISISFLIGGLIVASAACGTAGIGLVAIGLAANEPGRSSFRPLEWRLADCLILAASIASLGVFASALLIFSSAVEWSPFPALATPTFSPALGVACLLLAVPALASARAR